MSLLEHFFGPAPQHSREREFLLDGDIRLLMFEHDGGEQVAIASWPGRMAADSWLASRSEPWYVAHRTNTEEGSHLIAVEAGSGLTLLLGNWPRAAWTQSSLTAALEAHARAHRDLRQLLLPL